MSDIKGKIMLLTAVVILALNTIAQATNVSYGFELKRAEDRVNVSREQNETIFTITSPSGIGAAMVSRVLGQWPRDIVLRFRYENGRGFENLESLRLTTAGMQICGSLKESEKLPFYLANSHGEFEPGTPEAGYLKITITKQSDVVEVALPPNLLAGSEKLQIEWIDFYRK